MVDRPPFQGMSASKGNKKSKQFRATLTLALAFRRNRNGTRRAKISGDSMLKLTDMRRNNSFM